MKIKTSVQIGLDTNFETALLRLDPPRRKRTGFPEFLKAPNIYWKLYGVDFSTGSIDFIARRYEWINSETEHHPKEVEHIPPVYLCAGLISREDSKFIHHQKMRTQKNGMYWGYENFAMACTLDELLEWTNGVDLLMMDIEGAEHKVLNDYSWAYAPDVIRIDVHGIPVHGLTAEERTQKTIDLEHSILRRGYELSYRNVEPRDRPLTLNDKIYSYEGCYIKTGVENDYNY